MITLPFNQEITVMRHISLGFAASFALICITRLAPGPVLAESSDAVVTVIPEETDEILANPGMGWETFHTTARNDKSLPSWIPSTVHYARWGWGKLEPEKGKIDYDFLDGILKETRTAGQTMAFRAMCCSTSPRQPYHPKWLPEIGGKVVITRYADGPDLEVPVLDDPHVLAAHLDFIKRWALAMTGIQISTM